MRSGFRQVVVLVCLSVFLNGCAALNDLLGGGKENTASSSSSPSPKKKSYGGLWPDSARSFNVRVKIDQASWVRAYGNVLPSLEIDLVGINVSEKPTWENYSVSKYFNPNDSLRLDADRTTLTFSTDDRQEKVLSAKDPIWGQWVGGRAWNGGAKGGKGAKWLFVLANLPGVGQGQVGAQDPRLIVLPLIRKRWPMGTKDIEILIKSSMAVCTTPLKQEK